MKGNTLFISDCGNTKKNRTKEISTVVRRHVLKGFHNFFE